MNNRIKTERPRKWEPLGEQLVTFVTKVPSPHSVNCVKTNAGQVVYGQRQSNGSSNGPNYSSTIVDKFDKTCSVI